MFDWVQAGSVAATSFFASSVEAVEALTIVLAAGIVRGWRSALVGVAVALALLAAVVAAFGNAIATVPIQYLQVVVGTVLVLFGIRWLRKAMLRSAGLIELRDEAANFMQEKEVLGASAATASSGWDAVAFLASFKAVLLEGIEVVIIVIGLGATGNRLLPASLGAVVACLLVVLAALLLRRPLARVPENTLKFVVGVMVSGFGLFWFGEGIGVHWPYGDFAIIVLMAILLATSAVGVAIARRMHALQLIET
jgi:uncharacterized membrane protein